MSAKYNAMLKHRSTAQIWPLATSFLLIFFLPHIFMVQLRASSLATGLVAACVLTIFIHSKNLLKLKFSIVELSVFGLFLLLCLAQGMWFLLVAGSFKALGSVCTFPVILLAVVLMVKALEDCTDQQVFKLVSILFWVILVLGWLSIVLPFKPGFYSLQEKAVFPIAEQSHYALIIGPLAFAIAAGLSYRFRLLVFLMISSQALIFPNLTLLVFCLFFGLVFVLNRGPIWLWIAGAALALVLVGEFSSTDGGFIEYFQSRLNFDEGSDNLSTLVFMQGVDDAATGALSNWGLGYGFQQLGTNEPGFYSTLIFNGFGNNYNREDGSFFAAKLMAEFGLLGTLISLLIATRCGLWLIEMRKIGRKGKMIDRRAIYIACCGSFLVELCVRGYGYFSPSLVVVTVFALALAGSRESSPKLKKLKSTIRKLA